MGSNTTGVPANAINDNEPESNSRRTPLRGKNEIPNPSCTIFFAASTLSRFISTLGVTPASRQTRLMNWKYDEPGSPGS